MLTAEQVLASQKATIETLFGLTSKAFEGVEKLVELNMTASKAALSEAADSTQAFLGVKDAQELLALQAALFQPLAGSETAVAVFKSAVAAGNNALESVQKAVKQASDVAEANFNAVANQAVNAAKTTTAKKR
jgi:phasin family protein